MFLKHGFRALALFVGMFVLVTATGSHGVLASDMMHDIKGVVKSIDKGTKTIVVKTADGTEHTIKWTGDTTVEGTKDAGNGIAKGSLDAYDGLKEGAKVSVKHSEKAGEKTAIAVKGCEQGHGQSCYPVMKVVIDKLRPRGDDIAGFVVGAGVALVSKNTSSSKW